MTEFKFGNSQYVYFPKDNKIVFGQDFSFFQGVPSDVKFYPIEELSNGLVVFAGDGYGASKSNGVSGSYGNGSIFIRGKVIEEIIDWCRENFVKKPV